MKNKEGTETGSIKGTLTDKVTPEYIKYPISGTVDKVKGDDNKK